MGKKRKIIITNTTFTPTIYPKMFVKLNKTTIVSCLVFLFSTNNVDIVVAKQHLRNHVAKYGRQLDSSSSIKECRLSSNFDSQVCFDEYLRECEFMCPGPDYCGVTVILVSMKPQIFVMDCLKQCNQMLLSVVMYGVDQIAVSGGVALHVYFTMEEQDYFVLIFTAT